MLNRPLKKLFPMEIEGDAPPVIDDEENIDEVGERTERDIEHNGIDDGENDDSHFFDLNSERVTSRGRVINVPQRFLD